MIALYRKYRPQTFSEVVGQSVTKQTLTHAIKSNRTVHSYLFAGPRGTGKTTMARIFAKALNCEHRKEGDFEPCNTCPSCTAINQSSFVDLIEIDAASNRGIDEIRNIKESVRFAPSKKDGYKIYIIDESHMLTKDASNALLKTLEEPPHNVIFILATTDPQKMIPTIHSRVQRFDFTSLSAEELRIKLETITQAENVTIEPEVIHRIVMSAMGGARDAESLLGKVLSYGESHITREIADQLLGRYAYQESYQLLQFLAQDAPTEALKQLHTLYQSGHSMEQFALLTIQHLRYIFLSSVSTKLIPETDLLPEERQHIIEIASLKPTEFWGKLIESFEFRKTQIQTAYVPHLPFELAIVETCMTPKGFHPPTHHQESDSSIPIPSQPAPNSTKTTQVAPQTKPTEKPLSTPSTTTPTPLTPPKKKSTPNPFRSSGTPTPPAMTSAPADSTLDFLNTKTPQPSSETPIETQKIQSTSTDVTIYTIQKDLPKVIQKVGESNKTLVPMMGKIKPIKFDNGTIYFELSSPFYKSRLEKCSPDIIQVMMQLWNTPTLTLKFVEPGSIAPQEVTVPPQSQQSKETEPLPAPTHAPKPNSESLTTNVDDIFSEHLI